MRLLSNYKTYFKRAGRGIVVSLRRAIAFPGEKVPKKILVNLKSRSGLATMQHMGWWREKDPSLTSPLDLHHAIVMPEKRLEGRNFTQDVWSIQKVRLKSGDKEVILRETCHFKENQDLVLMVERRAFDPETGLYLFDLPTLNYDFEKNKYVVLPRKR
jgi:hypothetical protein